MNEAPFREHQVEFVIDSSPSFGYGCGVGDGTQCQMRSGYRTVRVAGRRLKIDTDFETGRTPIDEWNSTLADDVQRCGYVCGWY